MKTIIFLVAVLFAQGIWAHKASDSYLTLNVHNEALSGRWDIALRDLDFAVDLDNDEDGALTWGEVKANLPQLLALVFPKLSIHLGDNLCQLQVVDNKIDSHSDGKYLVMYIRGNCGATGRQKMTVNYRFLADLDAQHRGFLKLQHGENTLSAVLVPGDTGREFDLSSTSPKLLDFIQEGIWHIWLGFDHILFLFSLLLPSVLTYQAGKWQPISDLKSASWDVFRVVTAFTLAHSITLSMAVLAIVELPCSTGNRGIAVALGRIGDCGFGHCGRRQQHYPAIYP